MADWHRRSGALDPVTFSSDEDRSAAPTSPPVVQQGSGAKAYTAFLDQRPQTDKKKMGMQGYCMGGPLNVSYCGDGCKSDWRGDSISICTEIGAATNKSLSWSPSFGEGGHPIFHEGVPTYVQLSELPPCITDYDGYAGLRRATGAVYQRGSFVYGERSLLSSQGWRTDRKAASKSTD
jgi:hypothetical protein